MKTNFLGILTVIITLLATCMLPMTAEAQTNDEQKQAERSVVRVGTFDSRALALAYYRSKPFNAQMSQMHAEHEKAKAAGDEKRVKELEAEGPALQNLMHKQGFGTWPVDNVLEKIREQIPGIAAKADVQMIVCKWDIVYQRPGLEFVDVTDLLVKPFDPDESTLKVIRDIQQQKPVPIEQLDKHQH